MKRPEGGLTEAQLEIMEIVWQRDDGIGVGEIWEELSAQREVARTTVLTLVQRLERRGWLHRTPGRRGAEYRAACGRDEATGRLATEFVDAFFGGSASNLVKSLLGSRKIREPELKRLRKELDRAQEKAREKKR